MAIAQTEPNHWFKIITPWTQPQIPVENVNTVLAKRVSGCLSSYFRCGVAFSAMQHIKTLPTPCFLPCNQRLFDKRRRRYNSPNQYPFFLCEWTACAFSHACSSATTCLSQCHCISSLQCISPVNNVCLCVCVYVGVCVCVDSLCTRFVSSSFWTSASFFQCCHC